MVNKYKFEISVIASLVMLGLSIYIYNNLKFDYNLRQFFTASSTDTKFYYQFLETFDAQVDENAMVIGIQSNSGIFNRNFLNKLDSLGKFLVAQNCVAKVYSITNLNRIFFINNEFNARPLIQIDKPELYEQDSIYLYNSPEYSKHFFSKNRKACALTVLFNPQLINSQFTIFSTNLMVEINKLKLSNVHIISAKLLEQSYAHQNLQDAIRIFIISFLLITLSWILIFRTIKQLFIPILAILVGLLIVLSIITYSNQALNLLSGFIPIILAIICFNGIAHIVSINTTNTSTHTRNTRFYISFSDVEKAVFFSAISSAFGFIILIFSDIQSLKLFGLFAGLGILILFVISLFFVKLFLPRTQNTETDPNQKNGSDFIIKNYYQFFKHSRKIILSNFIILLVCIYLISKIQINGTDLNKFPSNHPIPKSLLFFENEFGGSYPIDFVLTNKLKFENFYELSQLKKVDTFIQFLEDSCKLQLIRSPISLIKATNKAFKGGDPKEFEIPKEQTQLNVYLQSIMQTEYAEDLRRYLTVDGHQLRISGTCANLNLIDKQMLETKIKRFSNHMPFSVQQTGATYVMDLISSSLLYNILPNLLITIFIVSILIWSYFKRICLIPIALIPNLLHLLLLAGFMGATGIYLKADTAILFFILFALSVDYTIHFLNNFKTEKSKSNNLDEALRASFALIAKPLIINTLLLFFGFLSLLITNFKGSYIMGLLLSLCMVLAWLCNLILLPILIKKYFNHSNDNQNQ